MGFAVCATRRICFDGDRLEARQLTICTSLRVVSSMFDTSDHGFCSKNVVRILLRCHPRQRGSQKLLYAWRHRRHRTHRMYTPSGPLGSMIADIPAIIAELNILNWPVFANSLKSGTSR